MREMIGTDRRHRKLERVKDLTLRELSRIFFHKLHFLYMYLTTYFETNQLYYSHTFYVFYSCYNIFYYFFYFDKTTNYY